MSLTLKKLENILAEKRYRLEEIENKSQFQKMGYQKDNIKTLCGNFIDVADAPAAKSYFKHDTFAAFKVVKQGQTKASAFYVARPFFRNARVEGRQLADNVPQQYTSKNAGELVLLCVHGSAQKQGLGKILLAHSLLKAKQNGMQFMVVEKAERSPTKLYERSGFNSVRDLPRVHFDAAEHNEIFYSAIARILANLKAELSVGSGRAKPQKPRPAALPPSAAQKRAKKRAAPLARPAQGRAKRVKLVDYKCACRAVRKPKSQFPKTLWDFALISNPTRDCYMPSSGSKEHQILQAVYQDIKKYPQSKGDDIQQKYKQVYDENLPEPRPARQRRRWNAETEKRAIK